MGFMCRVFFPARRRAKLAALFHQVARSTIEKLLATYLRLTSDYPKSRCLPHAYLSLGEAAFASGNMELAIKHYGLVLTYQASPVYGYALYKKGWALKAGVERLPRGLVWRVHKQTWV